MDELVCYADDEKKILYEIVKDFGDKVLISGINYRKIISVEKNKIIKSSQEIINDEEKENNSYKIISELKRTSRRYILGTVLHFDADSKYLKKTKELYDDVGVYSVTILADENSLVKKINTLDIEFEPDVVVITGHDYYNGKDKREISNYENTPKYIEAVRCIRKRFNNDSVIVIAGACCSNFEALIANGANFASSPKRIHIHTYDPAIIAIKCATTSCNQVVDFNNIIKYIENGRDAFGGIETKGKMKLLL